WKKQGLTYALADGADATDAASAPTNVRRRQAEDENANQARRDGLVRLAVALWSYAQSHDRAFPTASRPSEIAAPLWQVPHSGALRYVYIPGLKRDEGPSPLAYEPGLHGPERWVLMTDGDIRQMTLPQIRSAQPRTGAVLQAPARANGWEKR